MKYFFTDSQGRTRRTLGSKDTINHYQCQMI